MHSLKGKRGIAIAQSNFFNISTWDVREEEEGMERDVCSRKQQILKHFVLILYHYQVTEQLVSS